MALPGIYDEVTHASTETTTVPTAAALTHVLHLLVYLLLYVRTYCTHISCTYCSPARTTYWYTYELHCWCTYVWILETKSDAAWWTGTYCTNFLYRTYKSTYCVYLVLMHPRTLNEKTTSCCTYVPAAHIWYSCTYRCTYAPTTHTAVLTDARTYPPYLLP